MKSERIEQVEVDKFFGIQLMKTGVGIRILSLQWVKWLQVICFEANEKCCMLEILKTLNFVLVRSCLAYGISRLYIGLEQNKT